jgi:hypothetical protein
VNAVLALAKPFLLRYVENLKACRGDSDRRTP